MPSKDPQSANIRPGMVFCGQYRIEEVLAHGGMATIYLAVDESTGDQVAVKVLYKRYSDNTVVRARFLDEGRLQAMLDHPNIVSVRDVISDPILSFVMEYVDGETLEEYLQREGPLDEEEILDVLMPVMSAVGFAHGEGIIHRDLKPSNILLARGDDYLEPKIMDFGVAKVSRTKELTDDGTTVGTLHYMSPEQIVGSRDIDGRADIYSLGCSIYKLCTGEVPFNASSEFALMMAQVEAPPTPPSELRPELSGEMEQLILKAISKQPDQRFQTIKEMTSALMKIEGETDPDDTITRPVPRDLLQFALGADEVARDQTDKIRLAPTTDADEQVDVDEDDVETATATMELSSTAVRDIEKDRIRAARRKSSDTRSMPGVGGDDSESEPDGAGDATIEDSFDPDDLPSEAPEGELPTTTERNQPGLETDSTARTTPETTDEAPETKKLGAVDGPGDADDSSRGIVALEDPDVDSREVTDLHSKNRLEEGPSSPDDRITDDHSVPDESEGDDSFATHREIPAADAGDAPDAEATDGDDLMSTEREIPAALKDESPSETAPETPATRSPSSAGTDSEVGAETDRQRPAALDRQPAGHNSDSGATSRQRPSNLEGGDEAADDLPDPADSEPAPGPDLSPAPEPSEPEPSEPDRDDSPDKGYSRFRSEPEPTVSHDGDESDQSHYFWIAIAAASLVIAGLLVWLLI